MGESTEIRERYDRAVERFVLKVKVDVNVLAVIVEGSVAWDKVWHKSDIDITVIVRDQTLTTFEYSIDEDGIVLNAAITTRTQFMRRMNRTNGGFNSLYGLARIVYTTDDTIQELLSEAKTIGQSDIGWCLMWQCSDLLFMLQKIEKWLTVKNDAMYAKLYILKAAETVAAMVMIENGEPATREALMRAEVLNPEIIDIVYRTPMRNDLNERQLSETLEKMYEFLDRHIPAVAEPILEYMADGEPRTGTMIVKNFKAGSPHMISKLMEYLVTKGIVGKLSQTIRITPKGRQVVEEIAYIKKGGGNHVG